MTVGAGGSIVIPAWNEAAVIGRMLDQLFDGLGQGVEVIVACNGCTDDTAEVARRSGHPVTILDIAEPGKPGAIRSAERTTDAMPRLYVDADVVLSGRSAREVLRELGDGAVAARPPVVFDTSHATFPVRSYARVRAALPSIRRELYGAGVFGLSSVARGRFDEFPDLVADDLFAARIVDVAEVQIAVCEPVVVHLPRRLGPLLSTLARVQRGNRELRRLLPDVGSNAVGTAHELLGLCRDLRLVPHVVAYCAIVVLGRVRSRRTVARWERDDSTRAPEATR